MWNGREGRTGSPSQLDIASDVLWQDVCRFPAWTSFARGLSFDWEVRLLLTGLDLLGMSLLCFSACRGTGCSGGGRGVALSFSLAHFET